MFMQLISLIIYLFGILTFPQNGTKEIKGKPQVIANLTDELKESSGLIFSENLIFTHNDHGGKNILYAIDTLSGNVSKRITISNIKNIDWEDLAQSPTKIFIGDMGNNKGNRKDLKIYAVNKTDIKSSNEDHQIKAEEISFYYPEQRSFEKSKDHNFDCEAIIYKNEQLFLFTKNRNNKESSLYSIPATKGYHKAQLISNFDTGGLITGAEISPSGNKVVLIGYNKKSDVFLWILEDFKGSDFFSGKKTKVNLGNFKNIGQAEGICFINEDKVLFSSEAVDELSSKLYRLDLSTLKR
jgi:hypothetical protein